MTGVAAGTPAPSAKRAGLGRISQTQWIVISMVLGILIGYLFPDRPEGTGGFQASDLQVLSTVFLRMIKSLMSAHAATSKPVMMVVTYGTRVRACTRPANFGSSPSRAIA